jgi:hypothetical protein
LPPLRYASVLIMSRSLHPVWFFFFDIVKLLICFWTLTLSYASVLIVSRSPSLLWFFLDIVNMLFIFLLRYASVLILSRSPHPAFATTSRNEILKSQNKK